MKNQRAFTIIELVIVMAIIAILAGIVLTNVTQYTVKGKDAAIKEQISQIRPAAADFFYTNGTYIGMCDSGTGCSRAKFNILNLGGSVGNNQQITASAYCMDFTLNSGTSWCVDDTGYTGATDNCTSSHISCQ